MPELRPLSTSMGRASLHSPIRDTNTRMRLFSSLGDSSSAIAETNMTNPAMLINVPTLYFVDRINEALQIAILNLHNKNLPSSVHHTLVTAGQMFGAGKSELGRACKEDINAALKGIFKEALVDDYLNANTISINLIITRTSPKDYSNLESFLRAALWEALESTLGQPPSTRLPTLGDICILYQKKAKRSLFIHWDEVCTRNA